MKDHRKRLLPFIRWLAVLLLLLVLILNLISYVRYTNRSSSVIFVATSRWLIWAGNGSFQIHHGWHNPNYGWREERPALRGPVIPILWIAVPLTAFILFLFRREVSRMLQGRSSQAHPFCMSCGHSMKIVRDAPTEPMWNIVGMHSTDFRPHFDGNLVNLFSCVLPGDSIETTQAVLIQHAREMAHWVLSHRDEFGCGDRFQLILGWPKSIRDTGRQIIKIGGDFDTLAKIAEGTTKIEPRSGWTIGVFDEVNSGPPTQELPD